MKLKSKYYLLIIVVIIILGGLIFVFGKNFQKDPLSPQNLKCTIEDFAIKLYWEKPLITNSVTFNVYKKSEYGDSFQKIAQDISQTEYHDKTETDPYANYNYYITSVDSSGKESSPSNIVTCKIQKNSSLKEIFFRKVRAALDGVDPDPSFTANSLLFDADLINTTALSANEIQAFLQSKNSVLATVDPKKLCGTSPASCDNTKTAAQLIYQAATLKDSEGNPIGVNPAVLLVTMQKEQSLITRTSWTEASLQYALDWAMGYAVYEDGTRIEDLKGFRQQLLGSTSGWWGASQSMRNNYELGRGPNVDSSCRVYGDPPKNPSYFEGYCHNFEVTNTTSYYDVPNKQWVKPVNKSTMALYRYTPHVFNGNYNFWYYWNIWFGSIYNVKIRYHLTLNTYSAVEGTLLKASFSIKNYNKITMKLDRLKVDVRGTGDPQDVYGVSNLTIGPRQTISFSSPPEGVTIYNKKVLTDTGSYNAKIKMLYRNKWYYVPGAVSRNLTIRAIQPTDVYLSPALSLSPSSIYEEEQVTGNFTISNKTNAPILLERLKVSLWEGSKYYDLLGHSNEYLIDNTPFSKNNSRTIYEAGTYKARVNIKVNGKWFVPSGNVDRNIKIKSRIEALSVVSQLTLNTYSFVEGNLLKASFSVKNNANSNITLEHLRVLVRGTGDPQDVYGVSNITIGPSQTLSFSNPPEGIRIFSKKVLTDTGSYNAKIYVQYKGRGYYVPGAVSRNLTIRAIQPTDVYLSPALSLSPSSIYEEEQVTGNFTISNKTNAPILLERLKVSLWEGSKYYDLLGHSNEYLIDNTPFSKNNSRTIYEAGTYKARVNIKVNGKWFVPSGNVDRTLTVNPL